MIAVALYTLIGILCLTACISIRINGNSNDIQINQETGRKPEITGEINNDQSGTSSGTGNGSNEENGKDEREPDNTTEDNGNGS